MAANFKMDVTPLTRMVNMLNDKLTRSERLLKEIGKTMQQSSKKRFSTGIGSDGKAWPQSQRVKKQGGKTLNATGRLKESIEFEATNNLVAIGSPFSSYDPKIHQLGGAVGRGKKAKLPARPFVGFSDKDLTVIQSKVEGYILCD